LQDAISTAQVIWIRQQLRDNHKNGVGKDLDGRDKPQFMALQKITA